MRCMLDVMYHCFVCFSIFYTALEILHDIIKVQKHQILLSRTLKDVEKLDVRC